MATPGNNTRIIEYGNLIPKILVLIFTSLGSYLRILVSSPGIAIQIGTYEWARQVSIPEFLGTDLLFSKTHYFTQFEDDGSVLKNSCVDTLRAYSYHDLTAIHLC